MALTPEKQVVGTLSFIFFNDRLCEVRSLAVSDNLKRGGVGLRLLKNAIKKLDDAYPVRPLRIFALTYVPGFFEKAGFTVTGKENFPDKIYEVCRYCARQHDCREIAVEMQLN